MASQAACQRQSLRSLEGRHAQRRSHRRTWNEPYCRMQKGCAVLRVMVCSQNTCSGHCTTADLRIRFRAYWRPVVSSVTMDTRLKAPPPRTVPSVRVTLAMPLAARHRGA